MFAFIIWIFPPYILTKKNPIFLKQKPSDFKEFLAVLCDSWNTHITYMAHITWITHIAYIARIIYITHLTYITHVIYITYVTYVTHIFYRIIFWSL